MEPTSSVTISSCMSYWMAPVGQTLAQTPHLPLTNWRQCAALMTAFLGMACGKAMVMAVVGPVNSLKASGVFLLGHFSVQAPQPVHLLQST